MKIVVYGEQQRVGAWDGDQIIDLNRALGRYLRQRGESPATEAVEARMPSRLEGFIAAGPAALEDAGRAVEHTRTNGPGSDSEGGRVSFAAASVKLHAPWPRRRIACAGGNYGEHLLGMAMNSRGETQATLESVLKRARDAGQWGFWKVPAEVAGPGDDVPVPSRTRYFDYEGEAAIVLGKRGKNIPADRLHEYVWGVTLLNDWSIRDLEERPRAVSFNFAKNFDGCTSMGPCIVVGELQPENVDVETRVNGHLRQQYNTSGMIFSFAETLEYLSQDFSFVPGDVISGGTNAGTAADKTKRLADGSRPRDLFLKPGDVVELASPGIGKFANRIVAA